MEREKRKKIKIEKKQFREKIKVREKREREKEKRPGGLKRKTSRFAYPFAGCQRSSFPPEDVAKGLPVGRERFEPRSRKNLSSGIAERPNPPDLTFSPKNFNQSMNK